MSDYRSDTIALIAAALSAAQGEFPSIPRDRTVLVQTRTGSAYTFSYAPLDTILRVLRPVLARHGLALTQAPVPGDRVLLRTTLLHSSGEWLACDVSVLQTDPGAQAYGSALTYARRYGVSALLCLATEEDDDGNAADGNAAEQVQRQKRLPADDATLAAGRAAALDGTAQLRAWWAALPAADKGRLKGELASLRQGAAAADAAGGDNV